MSISESFSTSTTKKLSREELIRKSNEIDQEI